jgi:hypothetical protein
MALIDLGNGRYRDDQTGEEVWPGYPGPGQPYAGGAPPSGDLQSPGQGPDSLTSPTSPTSPSQTTSNAPSPNAFDASKVPGGVPTDWARDFISRNPGDYGRLASAYAPTSYRPYDSQTTNPTQQAANAAARPPSATTMPVPVSAPPLDTARAVTSQAPPFQFTDPYTKLYEDVAQKNLSSLQGNNPQVQQLMTFLNTQFQTLNQPSAAEQQAQKYLDSLQAANPQVQQMMDYLNKQFQTLSTSQGYSPDELAVLQTQMRDPIEADRAAAQQRTLERASARGILPSSGVVQDEQRLNDLAANKLRASGARDIAINAIQKQQQDRQMAMTLGQLGIQIPQQQDQQALAVAQALTQGRQSRVNDALNLANLGVTIPDQRDAQALNVANSLYQLPRTAMNDALAVVNGSSPTSALSPLIQLQQLAQQNSQFTQTMTQQQQAALYAQLGQLFGRLFGAGV